MLLWAISRNSGGLGSAVAFARSRHKLYDGGEGRVTFDDVAGSDEVVTELREIVEFLATPEKFQAIGGRIPKGVLLVGPPGTGKTLLAKAVAGEAGVPFFSLSGSDFNEMYVGVGAARVRNLFAQAAAKAPCLIFIDELDAIGKARRAGGAGSDEERDQTLNQLLVAMDGFDSGLGVIVMAATNRPETLDPALVRPGRFDRNVTVDRPDIAGREQILKVHTRKVALEDQINLRHIAAMTPGFVGADLANLVNEAALLAARKGKPRSAGSSSRRGSSGSSPAPRRSSGSSGPTRSSGSPTTRPATPSSRGACPGPTRSTRSRSSAGATAPSATPCTGPRTTASSTPRAGSRTRSAASWAGPSPRSWSTARSPTAPPATSSGPPRSPARWSPSSA